MFSRTGAGLAELSFVEMRTRIACIRADEAGSIVLLHVDYRCNEHKPESHGPQTTQSCTSTTL